MEKNQEKDQQRKKEQLSSYVRYSGMGFQMIGTILLCWWAGTKLDDHFEVKSHLFTVFFMVFGVISSIYFIIRGLIKNNEGK